MIDDFLFDYFVLTEPIHQGSGLSRSPKIDYAACSKYPPSLSLSNPHRYGLNIYLC